MVPDPVPSRPSSVAKGGGDPQRVAVVTGGAVRVGRALSVGLAEAGYDVVIVYGSSEQAARETREEIGGLGRTAILVQADLRRVASADRIAEEVRSVGRLDLLVNSAATFDEAALLEVDAERWDEVMAVNLRAPHLLVRACHDLLEESAGSVVNIVDLSAKQAWATYPHHSVSKAALDHLTRVQARALAPAIRVNAVAPGAVLAPPSWSEQMWVRLAAVSPLQRNGSPRDVLDAVLYLARASFVTGQTLYVDGGRHLAVGFEG